MYRLPLNAPVGPVPDDGVPCVWLNHVSPVRPVMNGQLSFERASKLHTYSGTTVGAEVVGNSDTLGSGDGIAEVGIGLGCAVVGTDVELGAGEGAARDSTRMLSSAISL